MARALSMDLRRRVIEAIDGGLSTRRAAARFAIGIATAGHWYREWRRTGSLTPGKQGNPRRSQLEAHERFILGLIEEEADIALYEIADHLAAERGVEVCPSTIWYYLDKRGITFKKRRRTRANNNARM